VEGYTRPNKGECKDGKEKQRGGNKVTRAPQSLMPNKMIKGNEKMDDDEEQKGYSLEWWQVAILGLYIYGEPEPSRPKMLRFGRVVYWKKALSLSMAMEEDNNSYLLSKIAWRFVYLTC